MTTIVASVKHNCMCSDTRMTSGHAMVNSRKLEKIAGSIWGGAGDAEAIEEFFVWARLRFDPKEKPKWTAEDRPEVEILELGSAGIRLWGSRCVPIPVDNEFWAIGSGGLAAMGVMYCNKTPQDAIKIAMLCDEYSGGSVRTLRR